MQFKKDGDSLYAKVNYDTVTEDGLKISIGNIFSLSETGVYFDWGLEKCGFGQYSLGYKNGKWNIMNECMGPETSSMIVKALEEAIIASGDTKAIYCLNKIISLISYRSKSLAKCLLLIWNSADLDGGEVNSFDKTLELYKADALKNTDSEKNMVSTYDTLANDEVKIYTLQTNHYSFNNKNGAFYEVTLDLFVDVKHMKHGMIYVAQRIDLNTGNVEWIVNNGVNEKLLAKVFKVLESSEGEHQKIWLIWKNAVKIKGGLTKAAKNIIQQAKARDLRFNLK